MLRSVVVLLALAAIALAQWGRDLDPGLGRQLVRTVERDLAALLENRISTEAFIRRHAEKRIEAIKRFRNPEFESLFRTLLDYRDWQVQHRALLALEHYADTEAQANAWELLDHPHRRLREKAAITCIKLWKGGEKPRDLEGLLRGEEDPHVRSCLRALRKRVEGSLHLERVHEEFVRKLPSGLLLTPYLSGMQDVRRVAPGYEAAPMVRTAQAKPPPATRWTTPLLGYGEEVVPGAPLMSFGEMPDERVYHLGEDFGACLDGSGFYAVAEGVVRLIHSGGDMGTLVVVEHDLGGGEMVNAVYLHGGDTVFVRAGDKVASGQLIATMGMGFSIENGGRVAHLHFGLYPGAFEKGHNAGYRRIEEGLEDWHDPALFLQRWIERTRPILDELRPLGTHVRAIEERIGRGEFGRAYREARKLREASTPGSEAYVDALYLEDILKRAPRNALERARKTMEQGYPGDASRQLRNTAKSCDPIPGTETLEAALESWEADPLFKKALRGEARIRSTEARVAKLKDPDRARLLWENLLEEYGDTCLAPRLRAHLRYPR